MSLLTLTPIELAAGGGTPFDLTAELAASPLGSNTGILFANTGRELVIIQTDSTAGGTTVTSDIGTQVLGQTVPGITPASALPVSDITILAAFSSEYDRQDGSRDVEIDFGTPANVTGVVVVRPPAVL